MTTEFRTSRRRYVRAGEMSSSVHSANEKLVDQAPAIPMLADGPRKLSPETRQLGVPRRVRRRAAILDLEGTLVDSNEANALSWLVALHDFGYEVALDLLRPLMGMTSQRVIHHAIGALRDPAEADRILERRSQIFTTWYLPRLLPFVGTRALLQRMKRDGLRLIAATAAHHDEADGLVRAAGVADLFDDVVTGTDAAFWPHTDVVSVALTRSSSSPDSVLLLGDTPYDVASGVRAGVDVVALRCGGWRDSALRGAVAIYNDPCDLLRSYSTSPFFVPTASVAYTAPQLTLVQ